MAATRRTERDTGDAGQGRAMQARPVPGGMVGHGGHGEPAELLLLDRLMRERARGHAERILSDLAVAIEFTLISVMVGVILFPLVEQATVLLHDLRFEYWPYVVCGALMTLYLWASVISHSLTFVGWPMDLGHNLLYIVLAMALAIQMHFVTEPRAWFAMSAGSAVVSGLTVLYDLRLVERRSRTAQRAAAALFESVRERQRIQGRRAPLYALIALGPLALVLLLPALFLDGRWHLALIAVQIVAVGAELVNAARSFDGWTEPIVQKAMQDLEAEMGRGALP